MEIGVIGLGIEGRRAYDRALEGLLLDSCGGEGAGLVYVVICCEEEACRDLFV